MDASVSELHRVRRDGWTAERQLRFLASLSETGSVSAAAAAAAMSRESAYRLRSRKDGLLFAYLWDRILQPAFGSGCEVHGLPLTDGRLARLLGTHFRRKRGDFCALGSAAAKSGQR